VRGEIKHIQKALSRGTPRLHSRLTSTSSGVLSSICFNSSVGANMVDRRAFNALSVASVVSEISCSSELRVEVCKKMVAEWEMTRGACRGVDRGSVAAAPAQSWLIAVANAGLEPSRTELT